MSRAGSLPPPPPTARVVAGFRAETASTEAVRALARASRLLERASDELNLPHYRVLSAIAAGDERASRIAWRLALGKPTISAAVDSLCRRGLLERSSADGDQRVAVLGLTAAGVDLLGRVESEMASLVDAVCDLTPDGAQVRQSLAWLGAALDTLTAAVPAHVTSAEGTAVAGADSSGADSSGADSSGADSSGADSSGADSSGADSSGPSLAGTAGVS